MKRKRIIVAIHGILTGETSSAWQQRFKHFVIDRCPDIVVENREYWAGPFRFYNLFFLNHLCAARVVDMLVPYIEDDHEVSFVTHSNGADIALKAIRQLAALGHRTRAVVFIAGAIQADVQRNGIADLIESGKLGRAVAYCSRADAVLRERFIWPYGHLGYQGFRHSPDCCPAEFDSGQIITRWFTGYGHGTYFTTTHEIEIFGRAVADACYL